MCSCFNSRVSTTGKDQLPGTRAKSCCTVDRMNTSPQSMPLRHGWCLQVQISSTFVHFATLSRLTCWSLQSGLTSFALQMDRLDPSLIQQHWNLKLTTIVLATCLFQILAHLICEASVLHRQDLSWTGPTLAARVEKWFLRQWNGWSWSCCHPHGANLLRRVTQWCFIRAAMLGRCHGLS